MTTDIEQVKGQYYREANRLLLDSPSILKEFDGLWKALKFREAYLVVHDAVQKLNLKQSPEQKKIIEEFYWAIVN